MKVRSYNEMIRLQTFEDRFKYLSLKGMVGDETFGFDRYLNQSFYRSREWRDIRNHVITRDGGFDLGHDDYPISGRVIIHHINPLTPNDIKHSTDSLFDTNNLITVSHDTHNAIHYGDTSLLRRTYVERRPNDTTLW